MPLIMYTYTFNTLSFNGFDRIVTIFSKVGIYGFFELLIMNLILKVQDSGYNMDTNTGTIIHFYGHCYIVVFLNSLRIFYQIYLYFHRGQDIKKLSNRRDKMK